MSQTSIVQSSLLGKINERQVLRTIQARGPLSRAEVARFSGISAPTASKAVESLLRAGLLEEGDAACNGRGRPARKLRLACRSAQVIGLVLEADQCRVAAAGLDGALRESGARQFPTPASYEKLLEAAAEAIRSLEVPGVATLGAAISMPGLIDYRRQRGVLSPNLPITNDHSPSHDLSERLEMECLIVQESHALCLAERYYGAAQGVDDFAMLDVSTGVGLGVMSSGRLLTGHSGLAGEIGHVTVEADGRPCGCGNHGCLETVASDSALAYLVSRRLGRRVSIEEMVELVAADPGAYAEELAKIVRYLGVGLAAVLNLFNPSTLFVHGHMFAADPSLFDRVVEETRRRTLSPSFADCHIILARGSKRLGAVAAMIEYLTSSVVPDFAGDPCRIPLGLTNGAAAEVPAGPCQPKRQDGSFV